MTMSNKVYDWCKAICQVILPAFATVYWILSGIMGLLPYGEQVVGVCVAVITCLGAILEYSSYRYEEEDNDGITDEGVILGEAEDMKEEDE